MGIAYISSMAQVKTHTSTRKPVFPADCGTRRKYTITCPKCRTVYLGRAHKKCPYCG